MKTGAISYADFIARTALCLAAIIDETTQLRAILGTTLKTARQAVMPKVFIPQLLNSSISQF
jgi:hypothetical protein